MQPFFEEPIEKISYIRYNKFVVKKDGLCALFDNEAHQVTDFVKGEFKVRMDNMCKKLYPTTFIIYNEEAGIEIKTV